jgi:hypothetical protein
VIIYIGQFLPRDVVKQALAAMIDLIDYPNFEDNRPVGAQLRKVRLRREMSWEIQPFFYGR